MNKPSIIRDPIHHSIAISPSERAIIESREFQRLRYIKQVGFLEFAFPSATHSRFSHSLGVMAFATKMFEHLTGNNSDHHLPKHFHQAVRLAALLHDLGHAPLSHTTEMIMPTRALLFDDQNMLGHATHEDYTILLLTRSPLAKIIATEFDLSPLQVAALLNKSHDAGYYTHNGKDYGPVLRQIISSDLDADRMDYLLRDSYFCAVNYGQYDSHWLLHNLTMATQDNDVVLGLTARALFPVADYLLCRLQMFHNVYFHHTPTVMECILRRYFEDNAEEFTLNADLEKYIAKDDVVLWEILRKSSSPWAKRLTERNPYKLLSEVIISDADKDGDKIHKNALEKLEEAGIDAIHSVSKSMWKEEDSTHKSPILIIDEEGKRTPLKEYTPKFLHAYLGVRISRIYVDRNDLERARFTTNK